MGVSISRMDGKFYKDFSFIEKEQPQKLPTKGTPNSKDTLYNPDGTIKQERWYGPDGKVVRDTDHSHPGNKHVFPHEHEWTDGKRSKEPTPILPEIFTPFVGYSPNPNTGDNSGLLEIIAGWLSNLFK